MANREKENEIKVGAKINRSLMDHIALQRAVLDGANYMIIATDVAGTIFSFNRAAERNLGYAAVDVIDKMTPGPFHDPEEVITRAAELSLETGEVIEPGFEVFVHNARTRGVEEREWTYIRKDGTGFPVTLSITALRDEKGEIIGFLGIADDITEKKLGLQKLRTAEERFKAFMNNSPVVASLKDSDGKYVFVNKTMEQVLGLGGNEIEGKTDFDWLPGDAARAARVRDKSVIDGGQPIETTQDNVTSDGVNRRWHVYKFPVYDSAGEPFVGTLAFDITKQHETETALRKSEQRSRDLIEKSPGLISTHTLDGMLLSVNPAAAHSLGYEPEELVGRSLSDFLPPDRKLLLGEFSRQLGVNKGQTGTMRLINKQGEERIWSYTNTIQEDDGVPFVLGHAIDVTENKRTENALRESEERLRLFVEHTPAAVAMLDRKMKYVMTSRRWLTDYNLGDQDLIGRSHYEVFPDISKQWKAIHKRGMNGEVLKCEEDPFPRADGSIEWLHWEMYPWRDNRGKIGGIIFFTEVITERKRMQEELSLSAAIVESSQDSIMSKTLDGIVTSWNRGAQLMFGYRADEMIGRHVSKLFPLELLAEEDQFINKIKSGQNIRQYETTRLRKNGERFPVSLTLSPVVDDKGKIVAISKVARDITAQKQAEAELEIARDLALDSAKMKSEFLANMSHEIRTPMNGVIGMTDMLLTTDLSEPQREVAEIIKSSADSLLTIINDILDFSKIEAGKLHFETIDFDLRGTVESTVELFAKQAQVKEIEIASLIESDVDTNLKGDPGRLRQVLTNLIGNAIKFTETGEVVVRIAKESESKTACRLRFSVSDTGIGIEPEARADLFTAFTQADGTMTRKYGGTGLGLAISKQLVEIMGGEIDVESEPGEGSTFSFSAHFQKQASVKTKKALPLSNLENIRVLIVDDNATNRTILMHQLASWGMIADEAVDSPSAFVKLRDAAQENAPYHLAILDLMMPGLNGFELAYFIKADLDVSDTKLILMSSFGQRGDTQSAREHGIDGYLIKPVRQSDLFDCIATVMADETTTSDAHTSASAVGSTTGSRAAKQDLTIDQTALQGMILVAEDNLVNQKVIRMQLERLGYPAAVVSNGLEVLSELERRPYSLILMDCQMPEMDGYAAASEIRRLECGKSHIPIIAVTANAMEGEREKCLAAGMDAYITKPVDLELLSKTMIELLGRQKGQQDQSQARSDITLETTEHFGEDEPITLDNSVLENYRLMQMPGTSDLVAELVDLFISDSTARLKALGIAIHDEDTSAIREQAHALKGSSGNIGAFRLAGLSNLIEKEVDDLARVQDLSNELERELRNVIAALKRRDT